MIPIKAFMLLIRMVTSPQWMFIMYPNMCFINYLIGRKVVILYPRKFFSACHFYYTFSQANESDEVQNTTYITLVQKNFFLAFLKSMCMCGKLVW